MQPDPDLPGSEALLGPDPLLVLAPAVEAAGGKLLRVRASQIRYRPGRRLAVRYAADVEWADGTQRVETLGALVQRAALPEGLAIVAGEDGAQVGVWRYPHDPFLPGLPHAAYPEGARQVLVHLGIAVGDDDPVVVEPVVYRPGGRAVLRVTAPGRCVYVKVVRPGGAGPIRGLHDALAAHAPVPRVIATSDPLGLVVLQALEGTPLTRPLVDGGALPEPAALLDLAASLAPATLPTDAPAPQISEHVKLLTRALPDHADRIVALAAQARDLGHPAEQTVHGDFYEAQILVRDGQVSGLLDVDGARRGWRGDDPATLVGHLVALAHVHRRSAARIDAYRVQVQHIAEQRIDADALRAAVTGVLLGLATTSFRRQETDWHARTQAWLELAESWRDRPVALR